MLTPAYQLVIGDREIDTTEEPRASTVEQLLVELDMDTPADRLVLRLGNVGGLEPKEGDAATVELGYADDPTLTLVLTARVASVEPNLQTTRVVALSPAARLFEPAVDQTFLNKSTGDIVRELAKSVDVAVARADDGPVLPAYVADGRRSVYAHLRYLAELSGFDLYVDPSGELVFRPATVATRQHVFEFAKHIIELEVTRGEAVAESVEVWGESPGTSRGEESWAWLAKDGSASRGLAGEGSPVRLLERPVLRTKDAAQRMADAALARLGVEATRGRLRTFGRPQVRLGDSILVKDVPDDRLNGDFRVRAVRHRIDKKRGFNTEIDFRGNF